ncbi:DUF3908 family protein [Bacillus sp. MHSD17]|nr:DUF3908 family protein [Bacillus sp. MHSD17]
MAINMKTIEEWIAESNARHEEDFGHVIEEMKEVCVGLDNATLIYTKNVFCFGKKVEVLFFFQDHVVIGKSDRSHVVL